VMYREGLDVSNPDAHYPGFEPGRTIIKAGTVVKEGAPAVTQDLIFDRDVAVQLRDGTTIYTDVYRPADAKGPLPAIIGWSPYGKRDGFITFDNFPFRAGVPQRLISELDKFEGTDPNWWCPWGYVIVSPDARGAYRSEGFLKGKEIYLGLAGKYGLKNDKLTLDENGKIRIGVLTFSLVTILKRVGISEERIQKTIKELAFGKFKINNIETIKNTLLLKGSLDKNP